MYFYAFQADAARIPLADKSVDLVIGSPPYLKRRKYLEDGKDLNIARGPEEWVEWMLRVTTECIRVCHGPVIWVVGAPTIKRNYQPAPEGLIWEWFKQGGHSYRPCYWHKNGGMPGSGSDQWFRADVEYILCFKPPGKLPWADNRAMGHPCKHGDGGKMSNRKVNGERVSGKSAKKVQPKIANPGNVITTSVGGGHMGSKIAHQSEAPFPEALPEWFIRSCCPPGGTVLDPFSGSGTTAAVAVRLGRNAIACDLRQSQVDLTKQRVRELSQ